VFALPDQAAATNHYELGIPRLGSLILTHAWDGEVKGLTEVPPEDRPPVALVFFAFRLMVGIGVALAAIGLFSLWLRKQGRLLTTPWFARLVLALSPAGFVAILAGWVVTECGRQPWTVYGHLRTAESVSPVAASAVASSLALFVLVYAVLVFAFLLYASRAVRLGPSEALEVPLHDERQRAVAAGGTASPAPAE
jgi:cytochrome d ubiquinol oxidase subunit I